MTGRERGFTLLEVLVATLIMGIAVAGLISGLSQSAKNASRITDYDRAAMLARTKMNDLLLDVSLPFDGSVNGDFGHDQPGDAPSGWRASLRPFEVPPRAGPGTVILQRVALEIWWTPASGTRRSIQLESYRPTRIPIPAGAMTKESQAGVTLVEILIAVSLLSLLTVGMLTAMRLGFSTMDRVDARLVKNRRVVNSRGIIESEINGFVFTMADYIPQPREVRSIPFIQLEPQSMRFVSSYSLEDGWRGRPQIAAMQVIRSEQGVRLILNEALYTGRAQAGLNIAGIEQDPATGQQNVQFTVIPPSSKSFVLADRLAYCRFSYLEPRTEPPFQIWRPDWVRNQILPMGVRIEMAPLDAAPVDLQVTTVTAQFNVTRTPGTLYADEQ